MALVRFGALVLLGMALAGCATTKYRSAVPEQLVRKEAAKAPDALWKLPLGTDAIVDMDLVGDHRLLLRLRPDEAARGGAYSRMVDRRNGDVLWEFRPSGDARGYERLLLMRELAVYRVGGDEAELVAVALDDGRELWRVAVGAEPLVQPAPASGVLVVARIGADGPTLSGIRLQDGARGWRRSYRRGRDDLPPGPLVRPDALWEFYAGVTAVSPGSGETRWRRDDIRLDRRSPPPVLAGDTLLAMDADNRLHALDAKTGRSRWRRQQAGDVRYFSIAPAADTIYLRGERAAADADGPAHVVEAVAARGGERRWRYAHHIATVSNIVEHEGRVFFATPTRLFAVNAATGEEIYVRRPTNTSGDFPSRLRVVDDTIVFIGELMVAAYDAGTGTERYAVGVNPISDAVSLYALEQEISYFAGVEPSTPSAWGAIAAGASESAAFHQNMANRYADLALERRGQALRAEGLTAESRAYEMRTAQVQAQISSAYARTQRQIAMHASMMQLSGSLSAAIQAQAGRRKGERALLRRQTLLDVYGNAESARYVYRPSEFEHPRGAPFVGVTVVDLETGESTQSLLSPRYRGFGLWTLLDWEEGVAYHQGIGLDPDRYEYGDSQFFSEFYETFLIARPVTLP